MTRMLIDIVLLVIGSIVGVYIALNLWVVFIQWGVRQCVPLGFCA